MSYVLMCYQISAVLAALCLLPYVDRSFAIVKASSTKATKQSLDRAAVLILMFVFILVPVINTLFVLHAVDCHFRYREAK